MTSGQILTSDVREKEKKKGVGRKREKRKKLKPLNYTEKLFKRDRAKSFGIVPGPLPVVRILYR